MRRAARQCHEGPGVWRVKDTKGVSGTWGRGVSRVRASTAPPSAFPLASTHPQLHHGHPGAEGKQGARKAKEAPAGPWKEVRVCSPPPQARESPHPSYPHQPFCVGGAGRRQRQPLLPVPSAAWPQDGFHLFPTIPLRATWVLGPSRPEVLCRRTPRDDLEPLALAPPPRSPRPLKISPAAAPGEGL